MNIVVGIENLDKVKADISKIGGTFSVGLEFQANNIVEHLKSNVPPYPPPPPNSTYERTGTLGRGLRTEVKLHSRGVRMSLSNVASQKGRYYPPWVISKERVGGAGPQARIHRGRWYTLQEYVKSQIPYVREEFGKWVKSVLAMTK